MILFFNVYFLIVSHKRRLKNQQNFISCKTSNDKKIKICRLESQHNQFICSRKYHKQLFAYANN